MSLEPWWGASVMTPKASPSIIDTAQCITALERAIASRNFASIDASSTGPPRNLRTFASVCNATKRSWCILDRGASSHRVVLRLLASVGFTVYSVLYDPTGPHKKE